LRNTSKRAVCTAADLSNCLSTFFFVPKGGLKIQVKDKRERLRGTLFVTDGGLSWFLEGGEQAPCIPWGRISDLLEASPPPRTLRIAGAARGKRRGTAQRP